MHNYKRQTSFFDHIMRREALDNMTTGKINGKRNEEREAAG